MSWCRALLWAALFGAFGVGSAQAQDAREVVPAPLGDPSADELERARERFGTGTTAAEQGRWSDALGAFREAYELSGIPAALYNVGTTYRSLGRYVDARDTFDQLLQNHPELPEGTREQASELRAEVAARIAVLELRGLPAQADDIDLRLDGRSVPTPSARPATLETEGGSHTVRVTRPEHEPFVWEGPVAEGDRRVIQVDLTPRPIAEGPAPETGMSTAGKVVLITVLAVVVAGAAATTAILLTRETGLDPQSEFVVEL